MCVCVCVCAYMKQSSKSRTYILLLSEIGWGAVFKKLREVTPFISDPNDPVQPPLGTMHPHMLGLATVMYRANQIKLKHQT